MDPYQLGSRQYELDDKLVTVTSPLEGRKILNFITIIYSRIYYTVLVAPFICPSSNLILPIFLSPLEHNLLTAQKHSINRTIFRIFNRWLGSTAMRFSISRETSQITTDRISFSSPICRTTRWIENFLFPRRETRLARVVTNKARNEGVAVHASRVS